MWQHLDNRNVRKQASKGPSVSYILPPFKDVFLLLPQKANLLFLLCLFLFSQCLEMKEQSQVTVRNQRPTAAGNYLEYFVPFALSTPWSAAGAVKITRCRQDSESIHTTASKITLGPLSLPFFPDYSVLVKISSKEGHPNSMAICQMRRGS